MELDFEISTVLVTLGMWAFILVLLWALPIGLSRIKDKIIMTVASLPIIYGIVLWQKNR